MIENFPAPESPGPEQKWKQLLNTWLQKLKDVGSHAKFTSFVEKMRSKSENNPREVLKQLATTNIEEEDLEIQSPPELAQNPSDGAETLKKTSPLSADMVFETMPILSGEADATFNFIAISLYGEPRGSGKWSTVLVDEKQNLATKIYKQPELLLNAYDAVFMQIYGGKGGLPKFEGFVPNGYRMEAVAGLTIQGMLNIKKVNNQIVENSEAMKNLLSQEQAQEILNLVATYHQETGRVHGDLTTTKGLENIMIQSDGKPRLVDTEWERIGDKTPQSEIEGLHQLFSENMGIEGLIAPQTISNDEASQNLHNFMEKVKEMVLLDPLYGGKILGFKNQAAEFKVEDGQLLVEM